MKLEKKLDKLEDEIQQVNDDAKNVYEFAIHTLDVKHEENEKARKGFITIIIALILVILIETCGFIYYISNYGVLETTTEQEGIYNFIDSEGNAVSSDLSLDEMKELIEVNGQD